MEWGYLLILLSSVMLCIMSALRKEYQLKANATLKSTLIFMGVSSIFVCVIGIIYCFITNFALISKIDGLVFGLGILFAVILTINTCLCIFGAKYGSLAIITTFATLGTLVVSTVYGLITDPIKNKLNGSNIVGLCLSLVIIALSFIKSKSSEKSLTEGKNSKAFILICLAVFLFNGSALSVYSAFTSHRAEYGGFNFIFLYLFFCALICASLLAVIFLIDKKQEQQIAVKNCFQVKPFICMIAYGVVFFLAEFCSLTTTSLLPIVIQAPLSFAVNVLVVAVVDYLIYKQKLTKIQVVQIVVAVISGVCFAL